MFLHRRGKPLIRLLLPVCLTLAMFLAVLWFVTSTGKQMEAESLRLTDENVRRVAVQCYALEGAYATDLDYLIDNYGIRPDTDRFVIHYQYIGDNLMPDITVIPVIK